MSAVAIYLSIYDLYSLKRLAIMNTPYRTCKNTIYKEKNNNMAESVFQKERY